MAVEVLNVPEDYLRDVIRVIRAGLTRVKVPDEVEAGLRTWCEEELAYLRRLQEDEE